MRSTKYPVGKVLPEIRDLILQSPGTAEIIGNAPTATQNMLDLVVTDTWSIRLSTIGGTGRIIAFSKDQKAVITGNIVRVYCDPPSSIIASLKSRPLEALVRAGFVQTDRSKITNALEDENNNGVRSIVLTLGIRTVIVPRKHSGRTTQAISGDKACTR